MLGRTFLLVGARTDRPPSSAKTREAKPSHSSCVINGERLQHALRSLADEPSALRHRDIFF